MYHRGRAGWPGTSGLRGKTGAQAHIRSPDPDDPYDTRANRAHRQSWEGHGWSGSTCKTKSQQTNTYTKPKIEKPRRNTISTKTTKQRVNSEQHVRSGALAGLKTGVCACAVDLCGGRQGLPNVFLGCSCGAGGSASICMACLLESILL
jgi:hypothetical protein